MMVNKNILRSSPPSRAQIEDIFQHLKSRYDKRSDPWGLDLKKVQTCFELFLPLYTHYFRVRVHGRENVADRPYMVVSNHTGQLPFDGILITMSFLLEMSPPRLLRAMVDRFLAGLPFLGELSANVGFILGDRQNCLYLMERGESILVFPEGVSGIAKNTSEFYQLRPFTKGFFRMSLQTQTDILPMAVVGAEETYPFVYHARTLAKWLGLPALPITPAFPLLGLFGLLPLPSPIDIYIGKPFKIPTGISPEAPDRVINKYIFQIEGQIREMIRVGRSQRRQILPLHWPFSHHDDHEDQDHQAHQDHHDHHKTSDTSKPPAETPRQRDSKSKRKS